MGFLDCCISIRPVVGVVVVRSTSSTSSNINTSRSSSTIEIISIDIAASSTSIDIGSSKVFSFLDEKIGISKFIGEFVP